MMLTDEEILRKGIAANNAKALDGMVPVVWAYDWSVGGKLAENYLTFTQPTHPAAINVRQYYPADQVAPLIQRVKELEDCIRAKLLKSKIPPPFTPDEIGKALKATPTPTQRQALEAAKFDAMQGEK